MTTYRKVAALGSSYAAGPGIPPIENRAAKRSGNNYPHVVARALGAELVDLTVSGATTSTILDTAQRVRRVEFEPQIASLPADADLVLVTAAGNDMNYIGSAMKLAAYFTIDRYTGHRLRRWKPPVLPAPTAQQLDSAVEGLARIVTEARLRASAARVVLVDYLPMVGEHTVPFRDVPFDEEAIDALASVHEQLTGVFTTAAERTGADVVRASQLGVGHELGSATPWIQPLRPLHRLSDSFHPTSDGMNAIAEDLLRTLTRP
ncbi:SGNH/GDSL hydrolase family protein [Kocuria marina]|uniref:SGNH/GDSL hydrolase family protein n=1 Tax=Kocuria marina TaxID=223184 RepID=UPI003F22B321